VEIGICDAAINEHLWMDPVDTFFMSTAWLLVYIVESFPAK
jgi:hypothetical protein